MATLDEQTLAAFEARAASAEQRLAVLEAKLLGKGNSSSSSSSAAGVDVGKYMVALQELRGLLVTAKHEQERLEQELAAAQSAQKQLESDNSKLKYQVMHLKRAVVEGDEKLAALQQGKQ